MPATTVTKLDLRASVTTLPGVGPAVAAKLAKLEIRTIHDLLFHWPRTWRDMSAITPIKQARADQFVVLKGIVSDITLERRTGSRAVRVHATIRDEAGAELPVMWFNQAYLARSIVEGTTYYLAGTVKWDWHRKRLYLASPTRETELGVIAIYPETENLTSRYLRNLIAPLLPALDLPDPLKSSPARLASASEPRRTLLSPKEGVLASPSLGKEGLGEIYAGTMSLNDAIRVIHRPTTLNEPIQAKARLAYDEHLLLQLGLAEVRRQRIRRQAPSITPSVEALKALVADLPFTLTSAQRRAAWDLMQPLSQSKPSQQLLQGDVGSGKTVVGLLVALSVLESGYHVTWMVPTQVLARQLHDRIDQLLGSTTHAVELVMQGEKRPITGGQPTLFVGTHALLNRRPGSDGNTRPVIHSPSDQAIHSASVTGRVKEEPTVGLVIIDEQQRFGVAQREAAESTESALQPHVLTMTATPIPRSLALALLDEQSLVALKGRPIHQQPIITKRINDRADALVALQRCLGHKQQAFVIVPRIEGENDQLFAKSIEQVAAAYERMLPTAHIALLHGQQAPADQDVTLKAFEQGDIDLLVATTVVEVGVDVPNATVMVIEEAQQFGLAQLHQLRGRVGRGKEQGHCFLQSGVQDEGLDARLDALVASNDGFILAERDLELRGPGELLGTLQSGLPELKLASLSDTLVVQQARALVAQWLESPPVNLGAWRALYSREE